MSTIRRDTGVAVLLLLFTAVMFAESFEIRRAMFSSLAAETWPRILLGALAVLGTIYLVQSLRGTVEPAEIDEIEAGADPGFAATIRRYANPVMCFATFLGFLLLMPWLGMLIGGVLFVFVTLSLLGPRTVRAVVLHAIIAVVSVTAMWAIFSFGLGVFLPQGSLVSFR
jgi:hypothetical protein